MVLFCISILTDFLPNMLYFFENFLLYFCVGSHLVTPTFLIEPFLFRSFVQKIVLKSASKQIEVSLAFHYIFSNNTAYELFGELSMDFSVFLIP